MKAFIKGSLVGVLLVSICVFANEAKQDASDTLEQRVKPVGELCMAGDDCAAAPVAAAAISVAPRTGEDLYTGKCATCHATGAANAPKFGDTAAWSPRIAKGIETLYTNAIVGFNGMPAKGLCFDCSDEEIKGAVDYLVGHAK